MTEAQSAEIVFGGEIKDLACAARQHPEGVEHGLHLVSEAGVRRSQVILARLQVHRRIEHQVKPEVVAIGRGGLSDDGLMKRLR